MSDHLKDQDLSHPAGEERADSKQADAGAAAADKLFDQEDKLIKSTIPLDTQLQNELDKRSDWREILDTLSAAQRKQFEPGFDLDAEIESHINTASIMPGDHPERPLLLYDLGLLYFCRSARQSNISDLDMAIARQNEALLLTPNDHPNKAMFLERLGMFYHSRYQHLDQPTDVDSAIRYLAEAATCASGQHPLKSAILSFLGSLYQRRFEQLANLSDLDEAISCSTEQILLISDKPTTKPAVLHNIGELYRIRFGRLSDLADLDKAIERQTEVVLLTQTVENPNECMFLNALGSSLYARFMRLGQPADLDKAIEYQTRALLTGDGRGYHRPGFLINLGVLHWNRFQRLGNLEDLGEAIKHQTEVVMLIPDEHPNKTMALHSLSQLHSARYQRQGELSDLDLAIERQANAVQLTPSGHPGRPSHLNRLGNLLDTRFERLGKLVDLDAAIKCHTEAMTLGWDRASCLSHLGSSHRSRFKLQNELADIEASLEYHKEAVLLTPHDHPAKPGRLDALGMSFLSKYERLGKVVDLDASIERISEALRLGPEGLPNRITQLNHLGNSLRGRYERLGELKDLDLAIEYHTEAVRLMSDGHSAKPADLSTLGNSLHIRFARQGDLRDLDLALKRYTEAVRLTPDEHPAKPGRLNHLGETLLARFSRLGELKDLHRALEHLTEAVRLAPEGDPETPGCLSNLGNLFHTRYQKLCSVTDLEKALEYYTKALLLMPDGHRLTVTRLQDLGGCYLFRFTELRNQDDLVEGLKLFKRAATSLTGSPSAKIVSSILWALNSHLHRLPDSIEAYGRVVELIPQVAWLGSTVNRRYENLSALASIPMQAAAAAIDLREYALALEWLEGCRSVVWSQMLQLQNPLDKLRSVDPELANDIAHIARILDSTGAPSSHHHNGLDSQASFEQTAREHRSHASRWEELIGQARQIPGFERFLLSKKLSEFADLTYTGTVVTINVHDSRCDALALRPGSSKVVHIPLPSISRKQCVDMRSQLFAALRCGGVRSRGHRRPVFETHQAEDMFGGVLATLWIGVVRPILSALGFLERPATEELPHVAWCSTGPLAFLPLHAAGCFSEPCEWTFDYVISSYTPTLDALLNESPAPTKFTGILTVGQASQSGYAPLPGTVIELDAIQEQANNLKLTRIVEEDATTEAVLAAMQQHSWIHLACHASQDISDPTASAFQLRRGNLDLATITRKPLPNAELAFLSACETATGDEKTPDEAVHLAAGMLMSGYRTVIATMWSIRDEDAPIVAKHFYSQLFEGGIPDSGKAAKALHDAVGHLRMKIGEKEFSRWVPYIHMGR
ncbi:hypothetical protein FRC09_007148 [Ceratobasidium sp. 395]|nr:hypothetical protein FRC09_007148 [Ceratobasidium sp. 395]